MTAEEHGSSDQIGSVVTVNAVARRTMTLIDIPIARRRRLVVVVVVVVDARTPPETKNKENSKRRARGRGRRAFNNENASLAT